MSARDLRPDDHARLEQPPDSLDETGQAEWTRVVSLLVERGQWDPLRSTVLLAYCESYADWHRMSTQVRGQEVTTEGGKASPNPLLPVIDRAYRSLQVALEELLSPASWALAPVPKRKQELEHPWLRHPDETAKAYAAFRFYRDLGEQRAGVSVQIKFSLSARLIARWSKTHAWVLRTRLWDEHQDRITIAVNTDAIQTMRLEQADCGRAIQAAALETLEARMTSWRERGSRGEPPFSPFEAARLIRVGSVLEQTARGIEPEGRPGEIGGGSVGEALQDWATRIEAILSEPPRADEPIP